MKKKWLSILLPLIVLCTETQSQNIDGNGESETVSDKVTASVLSSGKWVKIAVNTSGMKMLSRETLSKIGFSDISKVSVYGNGGAQLPYANNKARHDDLKKIPVKRTSNAIIFYAEGPTTWSYTGSKYTATKHAYSDNSYYFITDSQTPTEIQTAPSDGKEVINTIKKYQYYTHHEENSINLQHSGREWYGEEIKASKPSLTLDLELPARSDEKDNIKVTIKIAGKSTNQIPYSISFNGEKATSGTISACGSSDYARTITRDITITSTNLTESMLTIDLTMASGDQAWLDYVTASCETALSMGSKTQVAFRNTETFQQNSNTATRYIISDATKEIEVWDITDCTSPRKISTTTEGSELRFDASNGKESNYIAFDPNSSFEEPAIAGSINNQNLHGQKGVEYIIITHRDFVAEANRLAEAHREHSGISVAVAVCDKIYNEFSSGKNDVTAIRDYIKMVYDRGQKGEGDKLRNVLLFGQGSYDNMTEATNNRILTYQSSNSLSTTQTYVTDDFFGWLDDNEGANDIEARMDIGVGRFPCETPAEAKALVDKSITYLTNAEAGSWKTRMAFVADDGDDNEHLINAAKLADKAESMHGEASIKRIFLEKYAAQQTTTGVIYNEAHKDFMEAVNDGSLIINYVGHAAAYALTGDGLFEQKNIKQWTNKNRLPFFITAACDFGPFDLHEHSAGEESLIYENGGFIGVFTTTRIVYSSSNYKINDALYDYLLENDENGRPYSTGEAVGKAKAATGGLVNSLKYVLLGDPAIVLKRNDLTIVTDSVNGVEKDLCDTPLKAIELSSIAGSVRNADGSIANDFNGKVSIVLYDKKNTTKTTGIKSSVYSYMEYKTPIYSGTADVVNGRFTSNFILSKDIDFEIGYGRSTYYAISEENVEANGYDNEILIGGISEGYREDTEGPDIVAWIDYEKSKDINQTGSSPVLYARINDISGINTTGLGIGHDLCVYINGDRSNAICLNSNFVYDAGSHTSGTLKYQFSPIEDGQKEITLKAWDNMNNSSIVSLKIDVRAKSDISFGKTELYPSPLMSGQNEVKIRFSHNDSGNTFDIQSEVFSLNGQKMCHSNFKLVATSNQTEEISLTSHMPEINALSKGLYIVKIKIKSSSGREGEFTKRLAIAINR